MEHTMANSVVPECDIEEVKKHLPFYYAAQTGDSESLAKFLSSGEFEEANNAENFELSTYVNFKISVTPLHIAAYKGFLECSRMLIDYGIDVNSKATHQITPLHYAAKNGRHLCLKMLLEAGADCTIPITIDIYSPFSQRLPAYYKTGCTALHLAAKFNHIECVKELLQFGADCGARDEMGNTCLHDAAEAGLNECVLFLLRNTCCTSFLSLPSENYASNIPLHFAVEYGMLESVKELVRLGSDINHLNGDGMSPLHLVCCHKKLPKDVKMEILKILVLEGHNTDMNNALHPAFFQRYDTEVKAFLVAYGANINVENKNTGFTFLEHELVYHRDTNLVKCILNCMPQRPFLKSFKIYPYIDVPSQKSAVWYSPVLPNDVTFRLVRDDKMMYVEMTSKVLTIHDREDSPTSYPLLDTILKCPLKKLILLQQPFLDILYEHINNQLREEKYIRNQGSNFRYQASISSLSHKDQLLQLQHHLWYQKMAFNPSTLQHHCRFSIRECMGPSNIRHARKLPLPEKLQSYLLLESSE